MFFLFGIFVIIEILYYTQNLHAVTKIHCQVVGHDVVCGKLEAADEQ